MGAYDLSQTIQIEKIQGIVKPAMLSLRWRLEKERDGMQHYSVDSPLMPREHGIIIDDIHIRMPENEIGIIIPFTESEKICWECGAERMLELQIHIDCGCVTWFDWCYNPQHERKRDG